MDEATASYFNQDYITRGLTEVRLFMPRFGVSLPTRNQIDVEKQKFHPDIQSHENKCSSEYTDTVSPTVEELLESIYYTPGEGEQLHLEAESGLDATGLQ